MKQFVIMKEKFKQYQDSKIDGSKELEIWLVKVLILIHYKNMCQSETTQFRTHLEVMETD